jgi:CYTH domain-containing protein
VIFEIEHKYSVKPELWKNVRPSKSVEVKQAYLHSDPAKTIRVRTMDGKGYITIKGATKGASRPEYEYEIPHADALELIAGFSSHVIEKKRHYVEYAGNTWEVDEFFGENEGLFVAEIELSSEDQEYALPGWTDRNITQDKRYSNSNLALKPYKTW